MITFLGWVCAWLCVCRRVYRSIVDAAQLVAEDVVIDVHVGKR